MFIAGCGSNTTDPEMGVQPSTGVPSAGATAAPSTAGAGNTAGGGADVTSVTCGANTCTNPAASFLPTLRMFMPSAMLATPCCLPDGGCGWQGSAGECTPPPDKAMCPAPSIPGFPAMLTGCCIESTQTCGIDSSALGLGCMMPQFGGGTRTNCDGTPVAPPAGTAGSPAGAAGASAGAAGAAGAATGAAGADAAAGAGAEAGAAGAAAGAGAEAAAGSGGAESGAAGASAGAGGS